MKFQAFELIVVLQVSASVDGRPVFVCLLAAKMTREIGQEKTHFGGRDGLITETTGGWHKHNFWRCEFCSWELGGKTF